MLLGAGELEIVVRAVPVRVAFLERRELKTLGLPKGLELDRIDAGLRKLLQANSLEEADAVGDLAFEAHKDARTDRDGDTIEVLRGVHVEAGGEILPSAGAKGDTSNAALGDPHRHFDDVGAVLEPDLSVLGLQHTGNLGGPIREKELEAPDVLVLASVAPNVCA